MTKIRIFFVCSLPKFILPWMGAFSNFCILWNLLFIAFILPRLKFAYYPSFQLMFMINFIFKILNYLKIIFFNHWNFLSMNFSFCLFQPKASLLPLQYLYMHLPDCLFQYQCTQFYLNFYPQVILKLSWCFKFL